MNTEWKAAPPVRKRRGEKYRKERKRFFPIFFFILLLGGTCVFLYPFAVPRETHAESRVTEAWALDVRGKETAELGVRNPEASRVYVSENRVVASGMGRITENTAQGRLLARRAALVDARRNLLVLQRKLLRDSVFQLGTRSVSGHITARDIHSERIEGDFYFLAVDISLDELLKSNIEEDFPVFP